MWDGLRMTQWGAGLLSWYLFYFGPTENLSDIFIEHIAPVSEHSSCRLCLSWWIQRAPELQQVGGCTPQSCRRTGMRSHQGFLLSFPLVPAHTPGKGLSQGAPPRGAAELYVLLLSSPSMGVSQPFCLMALTWTLRHKIEKTCLSFSAGL